MSKVYYIEELEVDPRYGRMKMQHSELLDGNINNYIKSKDFKVTDKNGKEIKIV